jgi:hypothetical protein
MPKHSTPRTPYLPTEQDPEERRSISTRKVRNIVTPSGRGARGHYPSLKSPIPLKIESLVEKDVIRTLDVSTLVEEIVAQPCVFEFEHDGNKMRYTPDVLATICGQAYYIETKHAGFVRNPDVVERIRRIAGRFRAVRLPFFLILDTDVRGGGLQEELKFLQRMRPLARPRRTVPDKNAWDLAGTGQSTPGLEQRWHAAQRECDALLTRLMNRDPGDLLPESAT